MPTLLSFKTIQLAFGLALILINMLPRDIIYIQTMEKIALISKDRALFKELSVVLPKGTKLIEGTIRRAKAPSFFSISIRCGWE